MQTSLTNIPPFNPPAWCFNAHVHTIASSLLNRPEKPVHKRVEIPTPDGDFLEIDVADASNSNPVIVLFHGLEGSTDRYYIIHLIQAFCQIDYSVVAVNFRGCGTRMNRKRRFYHSGATCDYLTVFNWVKEQFPASKMGAVGFSLGGNALLKSLGEEGREHLLDAAVAVSVPYALKAGSLNINHGFNKVYQYRFLNSLTAKLEEKRRTFPDLPTFTGSTLYDFDDQVTAPLHGFKGADDYYAQCSSDQFIGAICTPTLTIHSRQDPICRIETMPLDVIQQNNKLDYIITDNGGHVGFWSKPRGWLDRQIAGFLRKNLQD